MAWRTFGAAGWVLGLGIALAGCDPGAGDDDSAGDDDASGDDDAVADTAPVISDLAISLQAGEGGDHLVFTFHFVDPNADIPGGSAAIFVDDEEAAGAEIPPTDPRFEEGDLELSLGVPEGNLTYGATFRFGVRLTDDAGLESNHIELQYTIPDEA